MGKVILTVKNGRTNTFVSLKCNSNSRAAEIAAKRPNVIDYKYFEAGDSASGYARHKKKVIPQPTLKEQMMQSGDPELRRMAIDLLD